MYINNKKNNTNNGDIMEIFETIIRSIISLVVLFLVTKLIGKRHISQLNLFDYVIGISIGNFSAEMIINLDSEVINGITAILMFGLIAYLFSYLSLKSIEIRRFFYGVPTIIIQDGKILYNNMKKAKMDVNDLLEQCRINGYFDVNEIDYAVLEANGVLSILPKAKYDYVRLKDMNLKGSNQGLCANIIIDGVIMDNNLKSVKKSIKWLKQQIKVKGYDLDDILLATINDDDSVNFYLKERVDSKDILE